MALSAAVRLEGKAPFEENGKGSTIEFWVESKECVEL